jgi:hypothetical protein
LEPCLVGSNCKKKKICRGLNFSESLGLKGLYSHNGPMPKGDYCGYKVALQIVYASPQPGRYSSSHYQWDTIRKLKLCVATQSKVSPQASREILALVQERGQILRMVQDQTALYWFS